MACRARPVIHGNDESSIVWRVGPRMAQEFRLPGSIYLDLVVPDSCSSVDAAGPCAFVAHVLDKAGVESAHIGGARRAARLHCGRLSKRTRSLVVASGPASVIAMTNVSPIPQRSRLVRLLRKR
jgi:hypothetical protein